ncbi:hypothetical protein [Achromobacter aloeverae]|uniref:Uncharacterized protein n=1 Tax=Achromobacter aloeverae TaxID=1750518 RepID=A0A4V1MSR3_9BURK|nr:hypothetical protein [Achromobacter aloeverae]RXN92940.1 hypothetical protein C7R54_04170 [Achromobacter aloeverae]
MSHTPPSTPDQPQWGYERPDCRGANALGLFIDDLQRVLDTHAGDIAAQPAQLYEAQAQANELVRRYAALDGAPAAFTGQSVNLRVARNSAGAVQLVPLFSASLKQALITLLNAGGSRQ